MLWLKGVKKDVRKGSFINKVDSFFNISKYLVFRRRKYMYVIVVDSDYIDGFFEVIKKIFDVVFKEKIEGLIGFILLIFFFMFEIQFYLFFKGFNFYDFDVYICNSGSDLYYSSMNSEDGSIVVDSDYYLYIEYRWGGEGFRKILFRWVVFIIEKNGEIEE